MENRAIPVTKTSLRHFGFSRMKILIDTTSSSDFTSSRRGSFGLLDLLRVLSQAEKGVF